MEYSGSTERLGSMEGLRGVAAVSVVAFHFLVLFFPLMFYGVAPLQHMRFEDNIHGTPLVSFISGTFAVTTFFVLSGFVLTIGFFQTGKLEIIRKLATKRYLRLMLPALISVLIAFGFIMLRASPMSDAYAVTQSSALNLTWNSQTDLGSAIYEGTVGIFVDGSVHNFNSVLWTMKYEFIGSFIVFATVAIFGVSRFRWILYGVLIIAFYSTWFLGFILGMLLADMYVNRRKIFTQKGWAGYVLLFVGICLGGFPANSSVHTIYDTIRLSWLNDAQNQALYLTVGALLVIMAILKIKFLSRLLSTKPFVKVGAHTYSLYLVHQPIIYTLGLSVFLAALHYVGYNSAVVVTILLTTPVVIVTTVLFRRWIENPSLKIANIFSTVFWSKKKARPEVANRHVKPREDVIIST